MPTDPTSSSAPGPPSPSPASAGSGTEPAAVAAPTARGPVRREPKSRSGSSSCPTEPGPRDRDHPLWDRWLDG